MYAFNVFKVPFHGTLCKNSVFESSLLPIVSTLRFSWFWLVCRTVGLNQIQLGILLSINHLSKVKHTPIQLAGNVAYNLCTFGTIL